MDISENIKAIRESKKIKQLEVAASLNIDPSNYAKLEKKGQKLTFEKLKDIANALGVSVLEIVNYGNPTLTIENQAELLIKFEEQKKRIEVLIFLEEETRKENDDLLIQIHRESEDAEKDKKRLKEKIKDLQAIISDKDEQLKQKEEQIKRTDKMLDFFMNQEKNK
jgi:transcriptional regulator with XRE-family HTH domain